MRDKKTLPAGSKGLKSRLGKPDSLKNRKEKFYGHKISDPGGRWNAKPSQWLEKVKLHGF